MELANTKLGSNEPWTVVVAWARPWHRPAVVRRPAVARVRRISRTPAGATAFDAPPDPVLEAAWTLAVAELEAAQSALAEVASGQFDPQADPWPEAMARHAVFRARRRIRLAQEALTGADVNLPWSTS